MIEKEISVTKSSVEKVKIKLPMYFYVDEQEAEKEWGMYVKLDENLTATLFVSEYEISWWDEKPHPGNKTFKIEIIKNYYPNEIDLANQITKIRFKEGVKEFEEEIEPILRGKNE